MFYSHEILHSPQFGVSTIWIVANSADQKRPTKRFPRKVIQEVDIEKACGKIADPGAPLALRLSGSLLCGTTRVYYRQCEYVLSDARKIRASMELFVQRLQANQLAEDGELAVDRERLEIGNDPNFVPSEPMPTLEMDTIMAQAFSQKTTSQMSPYDDMPLLPVTPTRPSRGRSIQLQLPSHLSSDPGGFGMGLPGLSSAQKSDSHDVFFTQPDDDFGAEGWELEIDVDGNITETYRPAEVEEEPQLPPLPQSQSQRGQPAGGEVADDMVMFDEQGDIVMVDEAPRPPAEPFSDPQSQDAAPSDVRPPQQARRAPRRTKNRTTYMDQETQLPRHVLKSWQRDYIENCTGQKKSNNISTAQAKRNAMLITFGRGLGRIGELLLPGMMHPLVQEFSGDALFTAITNIKIGEDTQHSRRRSSSEAFQGEPEEGRRVRPRLEDNENHAEQEDIDLNIDDPFGDQSLEVGRDAGNPMSDRHSSVMPLPWNRGSSAMPNSSVPNSAQKGRNLSDALASARGDAQDIIRYSDGPDPDFPLLSLSSLADTSPLKDAKVEQENAALQRSYHRDAANFLSFLKSMVRDNGERRNDDDGEGVGRRRWVAFDDLFVPRETKRETAAQAFYHTLCLVTRGRCSVEQGESVEQGKEGAIWIGCVVGGEV